MLSIRHTGIYVRDLETMKDFYCNNFGMKVLVHAFEKGNYIDTVLGIDKTELELYKLGYEDGTMIELIHRKGGDETGCRGNVYDNGHMHIKFVSVEIRKAIIWNWWKRFP